MKTEPYLFLEGRCDEAIAFYRAALGAELLMLMRYRDGPDQEQCAPHRLDGVMHAALRVGDSVLMLSDGFANGTPRFEGFAVSLTVDDDASARRCFDALALGGVVKAPLESTFFSSSFGMVADPFGVTWMVMKANA
jgi:PhnB protein